MLGTRGPQKAVFFYPHKQLVDNLHHSNTKNTEQVLSIEFVSGFQTSLWESEECVVDALTLYGDEGRSGRRNASGR